MTKSKEKTSEKTAKVLFCASAVFSVFAVLAIVGYILYAGFPAFREIGVFNFLFGKLWAPDFEKLPPSERFGILPMIVGSVIATFGALLVGGIAGVFAAIFLVFFCPKKLKPVFTQMIALLAGIPSIIYGFFGLVQVVPLLAKIGPDGNGKGVLAVAIILGVMILPTVASIAKDAVASVPDSYFEGALALGVTKEQAVFKVMLPAARSGVMTALGLGMGRAVGETMAVLMIAGNTVQFPAGLFDNFRTLTINIALEMDYATGLHKQALIATGAVLLVFVLLLNLALHLYRHKKPREKKRAYKPKGGESSAAPPVFVSKTGMCRTWKYVSFGYSGLTAAMLGYLIVFVMVKGLPHLSFDLLFGESTHGHMTLAPAFVSTGILILIALAIALPLGIGAAIYLVEYAKKGSRLVRVIRLFTDTLAGIPSVVFGLFGVIVFNDFFGFGYSLLSGGLTVSLMILPTIIRSTEESLLAVEDSLREASFALGAGKVRTIFRVVLPCALKGILTAIILGIGRIVGESAALIFTAGSVSRMPTGIMSPGSSFAVMMYVFASEGLYLDYAYATAAILMLIVAILNALVLLIGRRSKKA